MRVRRRLRLRWIAVIALVSVGAYFALDVIALQLHQSRGAAQLARAMSAESASLDLGGIPFLPSYLRGRTETVDVEVIGSTGTGGIRVQEVSARLVDVSYSWPRIWALTRSRFSSRTDVVAGEVTGTLRLSASDLDDYIGRRVPLVDEVRVSSAGIIVFFELLENARGEASEEDGEDQDERARARYLPRVEDGKLAFLLLGTAGLPSVFRQDADRIQDVVDLPRLPDGLRADVRLGDGVVIMDVSGLDIEVTIGEAQE